MQRCVLMTLACLLVEFASPTIIAPPIPVLPTEPGIRRLPYEPKPKVELEVFFELNCGDSRAAWPILKAVQDFYGNDRLDLVIQQMPLPYHRNGFLCTQGIYAFEDYAPAFTFNYIDAVFANMAIFSTSYTVNMTEIEVLDNLANIAVAATGVDKDTFINAVGIKRSHTVSVWKYGVKRSVAATPVYFVNGVDVVVGTDFTPTFAEWIAFLDPIINAP